MVHGAGVLHKLLVGEAAAVLDGVAAAGVNEVCDGVVSVVQHSLNVLQLEEDHKLDRYLGVVLGPDLRYP